MKWALVTADRNFRSFILSYYMSIMRLSFFHEILTNTMEDSYNGNDTLCVINLLFQCYLKCIEEGRTAKRAYKNTPKPHSTVDQSQAKRPRISEPLNAEATAPCGTILSLLPTCIKQMPIIRARHEHDHSLTAVEGYLTLSLATIQKSKESELATPQRAFGSRLKEK